MGWWLILAADDLARPPPQLPRHAAVLGVVFEEGQDEKIVQLLASILTPIVWPLVVILIVLLVLREFRDATKPIFLGIVNGVAKDASSNAKSYLVCLMFGMSASLSAFWDVFHGLDATTIQMLTWVQILALCSKVANPFIVAALAYATQNGFTKSTPATVPPTPSNPPFTPNP